MLDKKIYMEQVQLYVNGCYNGKLDGIEGKLTEKARERFKALESPVLTIPKGVRYMTAEDKLEFFGAGKRINESRDIDTVFIPALAGVECCGSVSSGNVRCHKILRGDLMAIFRDLTHEGLMKYLLSYDGCYVNRNVRGGRSLSMHAYGAAIDLNAQWNGMGVKPSKIGDEGCVAHFVPIFARYGWYWGGNFTRCDGMHFEKCIMI